MLEVHGLAIAIINRSGQYYMSLMDIFRYPDSL